MPRLFALTRSRGPAWNAERPMEEQGEWHSHAVFMNALHRDGFVLLVDDPWTRTGLLVIKQIAPWTLRLGAL